jgi:hypothetical protein
MSFKYVHYLLNYIFTVLYSTAIILFVWNFINSMKWWDFSIDLILPCNRPWRPMGLRCRGEGSWDHVVGIVTGYGLDNRGIGVLSPGGGKNFHFSMSSRLAVEPTQPHIKWVLGALSEGKTDQGVKLTTHLPLAPRSRKRGSIHALSHFFMAQCLTLPNPSSHTMALGLT